MNPNEKARFLTGARKFLYATAGTHSPDQHILETYWKALKDYQLASVERALAQLIATETGHVSPAQVRSKLVPSDLEQEAVLAHRRKGLTSSGPCPGCPLCTGSQEWQDMMKMACSAYARRIVGGQIQVPVDAVYQGNFPWQAIADAADLPSDDSQESHRYAWRAFYRVCVEEWNITQESASGSLSGV